MTAPVDGGGAGPQPLEEERDFFLRSLRDLEAERDAGDIDEVDYQALRDDYTARAAEVIRRLEGLVGNDPETRDSAGRRPAAGVIELPDVAEQAGADGGSQAGDEGRGLSGLAEDTSDEEPADAGSADGGSADGGSADGVDATPARPRRLAVRRSRSRSRRPWPWWQKAMLVAAVASMAAAIGWGVGKGSSPRLAGDNITGKGLSSQAVTQLLVDGQKAAGTDPVAALKDFNKILAVYPDQPQALTDEGWVLAQGGVVAQGEADLKRAEEVDPGYGITHAYLGIILGDQGDYAGAVTQLQYYLSHHPDPALAGEARSALAVAQKDLKATKPGG